MAMPAHASYTTRVPHNIHFTVPFLLLRLHRRNDTHPGQHWLRGRIAALGDAGRDHGD